MEGEGGGSGGSRTPLLVGGGLLLLVLVGGAVVGALFGVGVLGGGGDEAGLVVQTPAISEQVRKGKVLVGEHQNNRVIGENVKDATAEKERDATDKRRNRTSVSTEGSEERTLKPIRPTATSPQDSPTLPQTSRAPPPISSSPSYEETWPPSPRPPQTLPADSQPQVFQRVKRMRKRF